jgi:2-keto-4-pentenoate hydratase/2-oxohepta-3-ene-1,7-dioic acid hydratase in catechol pathway
MKLLNYLENDKIRLGIKCDQGIIDVEKSAKIHSLDVPISMEEVISRGVAGAHILDKLIGQELNFIPEDEVTFAPPVMNPEKILCVGLNYLSHSKEAKEEQPKFPVLFSKCNNVLSAHKQDVILPKVASKYDYEVELVIVIGKEAKDVSKEDALSYVFGYTIGNDLSARDLQYRTSQWFLGKSLDGFAPVGPYLVMADDIDPNNVDLSCTVNGKVCQSSNSSNMIFDCATIISYASQFMTLKPGDLIFTGTPSGVMLGYPEDQQNWLKSGDEVTVSIEHIGSLTNVLV